MTLGEQTNKTNSSTKQGPIVMKMDQSMPGYPYTDALLNKPADKVRFVFPSSQNSLSNNRIQQASDQQIDLQQAYDDIAETMLPLPPSNTYRFVPTIPFISNPHQDHGPVDPIARERQKSIDDWGQRMAYITNHALVCTFTDFIDAPVSKYVQNDLAHQAPKFMKPILSRFHIGCGHDHGHATDAQVWLGEAVGDFGSVPVVLATQYFAPGAMHAMEKGLEPVFGGAFHKSAELWSQPWAKRRGLSYDSDEYKQHVEELYHHEMEHLPQAAVWTISSIGLNAVTQRALGNQNPWTKIIAAKAVGAALTSGLVVGGRAAFPKAAREIDKTSSKYIFAPATRVIGRSIGLKEEDIEHVLEHQQDKQEVSWQSRLDEQENNQETEMQPGVR